MERIEFGVGICNGQAFNYLLMAGEIAEKKGSETFGHIVPCFSQD